MNNTGDNNGPKKKMGWWSPFRIFEWIDRHQSESARRFYQTLLTAAIIGILSFLLSHWDKFTGDSKSVLNLLQSSIQLKLWIILLMILTSIAITWFIYGKKKSVPRHLINNNSLTVSCEMPTKHENKNGELPREILANFDKAFAIANEENNHNKLQRLRDCNYEMERKGLTKSSTYKTEAKKIYETLFMEYGQDLWGRMKRVIPADLIHTFDLERELRNYLFGKLHDYFINGTVSLKGHELDATNEWFSNCYRRVRDGLDFEIIAEVEKLNKENSKTNHFKGKI